MWSLKNMSVSFRVKDQCQAAFHCPVYSGVAQAEVQPLVGVRGGVTARSGPLSLWPPFGKSAQIYVRSNKTIFSKPELFAKLLCFIKFDLATVLMATS